MQNKPKLAMVRIRGKVQGVSFRVWTRMEARKLALTGWVRNEDDGSVAALIAGTEDAVSEMLQNFWQGPPGAHVSSVTSEDIGTGEAPDRFDIVT
ncbi:acylphosphatase [Phyllobacterium sp. LjRoot231]|uniref:acylphosphatase n=1 Tax=Phyllobacterium sp. LjRoot231 TaxID=3342289 RepID=UPI003ECF4CBC